jgi:pimeloyl-ACP methyl ester carboxylesterase
VSLEPMQRLAAALPRAEPAVVPGAGHAVNLEARDATNAALASFLARV